MVGRFLAELELSSCSILMGSILALGLGIAFIEGRSTRTLYTKLKLIF